MDRSKFFQVSLAVGSFLAAPFSALSQALKDRVKKGIKVEAGNDRFNDSITLFEGDTFDCKVSGKDTNGDIYIFETTREKKGGPPLHFHFEQDEFWYILEGEFLFKVGEETFKAKAGDTVFGPRMIPHAFSKINEGKAKILMAFQPAGKMEEHFKAVSQGALSKLSDVEKAQFREANGFKVVGPALVHDKTK